MRDQLLDRLRRALQDKPSSARWQELARQFSVHLLARHGTAADREAVKERLRPASLSPDPLLRRIGYSGVILGGTDSDTIGRFLYAVRHDGDIAAVNLFFNAFH